MALYCLPLLSLKDVRRKSVALRQKIPLDVYVSLDSHVASINNMRP